MITSSNAAILGAMGAEATKRNRAKLAALAAEATKIPDPALRIHKLIADIDNRITNQTGCPQVKLLIEARESLIRQQLMIEGKPLINRAISYRGTRTKPQAGPLQAIEPLGPAQSKPQEPQPVVDHALSEE